MIYFKKFIDTLEKHNPVQLSTGCVKRETGIFVCFFKIILCVISSFMLFGQASLLVHAKEPVVIVIDPGHGGENLGAEYEEYVEKDMTMIVANAMKERLEQYEDVTVYLTHEEDIDMSLKERALFAQAKNADFLYSLHFNMSVNHNLFGCEVWISAFDQYYTQGHSFASVEMDMLTELGIYSRGIKTKLNDEGTDYYGIIRQCREVAVPAVIIEHCHLDQIHDKPYYTQGVEQWQEFGRLDADAVARYYQLSSTALSIDNSSYEVPTVELPTEPVVPDLTAPEQCEITITDLDESTGMATVTLTAKDSDSYLLYYNYSINGGNSYSDLEPWPDSQSSVSFQIQLPDSQDVELRANAYNGFDVWTESNIIAVDAIGYLAKPEDTESADEYRTIDLTDAATPVDSMQTKQTPTASFVILLVIICIGIICVSIILARLVCHSAFPSSRKKRKDKK